MFTNFLENRRAKKAAKDWNDSPLGQALARHTRSYFYEGQLLSHYQEDNKNRIVEDFYQKIFSLTQAENIFLQMRELVASYAIEYSAYQVICLKQGEKAHAFFSDCAYISADLYRHIRTVADHNEELRELKWKLPEITDDELITFCNSRCALHLYYLNGMNIVRKELKDFVIEKDWLQPFIKSMLIWQEDLIREKIGLSRLLPDSMDGLKHSTFMNVVINGHNNPYYEWEKIWAEDEIA